MLGGMSYHGIGLVFLSLIEKYDAPQMLVIGLVIKEASQPLWQTKQAGNQRRYQSVRDFS